MNRDVHVTFESVGPLDRPICSRFGSGSFPCGPVYKVRVTTTTVVGRAAPVTRRLPICRLHYEFGQPGKNAAQFKAMLLRRAADRLVSAHADEFQQIYEESLLAAVQGSFPDVDPSLFLGRARPTADELAAQNPILRFDARQYIAFPSVASGST